MAETKLALRRGDDHATARLEEGTPDGDGFDAAAESGGAGGASLLRASSDDCDAPSPFVDCAAAAGDPAAKKMANGSGIRGVDLFDDDDEAPEPGLSLAPIRHRAPKEKGAPATLASEEDNAPPVPDPFAPSRHEGRAAEKVAPASAPLPTPSAPSPSQLAGEGERRGARSDRGASGSASAREVRGPTASGAAPRRPAPAPEPSLPMLEATLVEDGPEAELVDAIPLENNDEENERSWRRRKRRYAIVVAGLVLVIGVLVVVIIGVTFSGRDGGGEGGVGVEDRQPEQGGETTGPTVLGIASPTLSPVVTPVLALPATSPPTVMGPFAAEKDKICRYLAALEEHMDESFARMMGRSFTTGYECVCGNESSDGDSFEIDCTLEYADGGETFVNQERMTFGIAGGGEYELRRTSWNDSSIGPMNVPQEVFRYGTGGVLRGCTANGCASCKICDDGTSVAIECVAVGDSGYDPSRACDEGYKGTFANEFDFATMRRKRADEIESANATALAYEPG